MFPDLPSDRRLTETELMQLADLERRLGEDDPDLVRSFQGERSARPRLPRTALVACAAAALALLVLSAVVGGFGGAAAVAAALLITALALVRPRPPWRRRRG